MYAVSEEFEILEKAPGEPRKFWQYRLDPIVWLGVLVVLTILAFAYDAARGCWKRRTANRESSERARLASK